MFQTIFENVRNTHPIIHSVTNYVTANDCANILLACGASPIMADDADEVAEITQLCNGLNLNIGTLNRRTVSSMLIAGKRANTLGHPVVLDPVGVGASKLRTATALQLLDELQISVIRGNSSEIKALASGGGATRGVDADFSDCITEETLEQSLAFARAFSEKTGAVIAITGKIDIVADRDRAYCIYNGHPMMSAVTGTGCQLSALTAAFAAANPEQILKATAAAVCTMGYAGELAYARLSSADGNASYRNYIIDAIYNLTAQALEKGANYEIR